MVTWYVPHTTIRMDQQACRTQHYNKSKATPITTESTPINIESAQIDSESTLLDTELLPFHSTLINIRAMAVLPLLQLLLRMLA